MNREQEEISNLWIAGLRSHEYKRGEGSLIQPDPDSDMGECLHCGLGVLCDVAGLQDQDHSGYYDHIGDEDECFEDQYFGEAELPHAFAERLGIDASGSFIGKNGVITSLAEISDDGASFAQLADVIEYNLEQIFT